MVPRGRAKCGRSAGAWRHARGVVAALILAVGAPAGAIAQVVEPEVLASQNDAEALLDYGRPHEVRGAAASRLIVASGDAGVRSRLIAILGEPIAENSAGWHVAQAMTRTTPPAVLFPAVQSRLREARVGEMAVLLSAMSAFRTRGSAQTILEFTDAGRPEAVREAAWRALTRLTGRDDLGNDARAWSEFLGQARRLSDEAWRAALVENHARRSERLSAEHDEAVSRLLESLRRVHLSTPAEERPALLSSLMRDPLDAVRGLGFDLASRELAAGNDPGEDVRAAATELLTHAHAGTRASAAVLINRLAPEGAEGAVHAALLREDDAAAAAELLRTASRWPAEAMLTPTLRWLGSETAARSPAADAAWALFRGGLLTPESRVKALAALRGFGTGDLTPAACSLLASIGDDADRVRLVPLLTDSSESRRRAAGQALVMFASQFEPVIEAARRHDDLFATAARGVLLHRATGQGYELLRGLPAPSPEARREWREVLGTALDAASLYEAAARAKESPTDPREREDLLELLIVEPRVLSEGAQPERAGWIARGGRELAELRLLQDRPEAALAALNAIGAIAGTEDAPEITALQTRALLALGRVELAQMLDAPAEAWLESLRRESDKPHAAQLADVIVERFAGLLSEAQQRELEELRARIKASNGG